MHRLAALRRFIAALQAGAAAYDKDPQDGAIQGCVSVVEFLREITHDQPELRRPFTALAVALDDLDRGAQAELLRPKRSANRHGDTIGVWRKRIAAVVVQERLLEAGMTVAEARLTVAREIAKLGEPGPSEQIAGRIAEWGKGLRQIGARKVPPRAVHLYRVMAAAYDENLALRAPDSSATRSYLIDQLQSSWAKSIGD